MKTLTPATRSIIIGMALDICGCNLDDELLIIGARLDAARQARADHQVEDQTWAWTAGEWQAVADRLNADVAGHELELLACRLALHIVGWAGWPASTPAPAPAPAPNFFAPPAPPPEASPCPQCGAPLGPGWLYDSCTACEWHA